MELQLSLMISNIPSLIIIINFSTVLYSFCTIHFQSLISVLQPRHFFVHFYKFVLIDFPIFSRQGLDRNLWVAITKLKYVLFRNRISSNGLYGQEHYLADRSFCQKCCSREKRTEGNIRYVSELTYSEINASHKISLNKKYFHVITDLSHN